MKKNIYIISVVIALCSCNSMLNKEELDTFTNDNFWTSENKVESFANTFYETFSGYGSGLASGDFYFNTLSDDQAGSLFSNWTFTAVPATSSFWNENWKEIRRANIMLEHLSAMTMLTAEARKHWIGMARLMRAWTYYHLVRMYGNVPWVNRSLSITDDGYLYAERTARDVVMDSVLADLNYACNNMRDNTLKNSLNQQCANAMKAEVCLYEGTFRKYRTQADGQDAPDILGAARYLTACRVACEKIMSSRKFSLNSTYQGNYNSTDLSTNPEIIFYKNYELDVLMHSLVDYTCISTQINGLTKDAVDSYLFTDGKPRALTSLSTDDAARLLIGKDTVMSINDQLQRRDARLIQTIDTAICYVGRTFVRFGKGLAMTASTGYCIAKFDNEAIDYNHRGQYIANYTDAPLLWLAEIYLAYAESSAELGVITQADLDASLNLLKARAGLPPLKLSVGFSDPANDMKVSDLIWEIRRERRCELMMDMNARYWDLVRWHCLDKLDSSKHPYILSGANVANDPAASISLIPGTHYIDASKGQTRVYNNKYYLYPIPSDQLSLNKALKQNYGW